MFCKNCGKEVSGTRAFCSNCGAEVMKKQQPEFSLQNMQNVNTQQNQFSYNKAEHNKVSLPNLANKKIILAVGVVLLCTVCLIAVIRNNKASVYGTWTCDDLPVVAKVLEYILVRGGVDRSMADWAINDVLNIDDALKSMTFTFQEDGKILVGMKGLKTDVSWLVCEYSEGDIIWKLDIPVIGDLGIEYATPCRVTSNKLKTDVWGEKISFTRQK